MRKYQWLLSILGGISLLCILLCSTTTALLTDEEQVERIFKLDSTTVDIKLHVEGIGTETTLIERNKSFSFKPWIENAGSGDIYAFLEMDVPMVTSNGVDVPIFTYAPPDGWTSLKVVIEDGYRTELFGYGNPSGLTRIESYTSLEDYPLMETATFGDIHAEYDDDHLYVSVKAYAVTADGFDGDYGTPLEEWQTAFETSGD